MSSTGQKVEVAKKSSDEGVNNKRKQSPTLNTVVQCVTPTRKIDPSTALIARLAAHKLACDIPRYGLTTAMVKGMSFIDLSTRLRLTSVQDVMHSFIRNVVFIALDVTEKQQHRTLAFIKTNSDAFACSFAIAYHPLTWFKDINDEQKVRNKTAVEMLRLFENVWTGIVALPAGDDFTKSFEVVRRNAGVFVRFFQGYIDRREPVMALMKQRIIANYKSSMNIIYRFQLHTVQESHASFKIRSEKKQVENNDEFQKAIGSGAIKIIEEHRAAFFKAHHAAKLLNVPSRCASGFDGDVSRRMH
jgi:hypothetical protein